MTRKIEERVIAAAEFVLAERDVVSAVDMLVGIGWFPAGLVEDWERGRVDYLEQVAVVDLERVAETLVIFRDWAEAKRLRSQEIPYLAATRYRPRLRFTETGNDIAERAYRIRRFSPDLPERKWERLIQQLTQPPDLLAFEPHRDWSCSRCGGTSLFLFMEAGEPLCLACAELDDLVFLGSGNAALTRRAKAMSRLWVVVVGFSRTRKQYERQGLLIEQAALRQAEEQLRGED